MWVNLNFGEIGSAVDGVENAVGALRSLASRGCAGLSSSLAWAAAAAVTSATAIATAPAAGTVSAAQTSLSPTASALAALAAASVAPTSGEVQSASKCAGSVSEPMERSDCLGREIPAVPISESASMAAPISTVSRSDSLANAFAQGPASTADELAALGGISTDGQPSVSDVSSPGIAVGCVHTSQASQESAAASPASTSAIRGTAAAGAAAAAAAAAGMYSGLAWAARTASRAQPEAASGQGRSCAGPAEANSSKRWVTVVIVAILLSCLPLVAYELIKVHHGVTSPLLMMTIRPVHLVSRPSLSMPAIYAGYKLVS